MSVVITKEPEIFQPSLSDDLYFIVSGDNTNQPKFRYVYNVIIDDYVVFEGKCTPNEYGLGVIDVQRIIDTYVQNYPISLYDEKPIYTHTTGVFSRPYTNDVIDFKVEVGEEYSSSLTGNITGFTGTGLVGNPSVMSNSFKSYLGTMGVNRNSNEQSFDIDQFVLSGSPSPSFPFTENCLFLTNSPRIRKISLNDYYTLQFTNYNLGNNVLSEPYFVNYKFYDSDDNLISSDNYSNIISNGGGPRINCSDTYYDTYTGDTTQYNILSVGAGPNNIYNFPSNTSYYTIQLYGKAIAPTPSPTPSITPSATPSATPNVTPSMTPTPSSSPPSCRYYELVYFKSGQRTFFFVDCDGVSTSIVLDPFDPTFICARSYTTDPDVLVTDQGSCEVNPTPTPTPTPSPSFGAPTTPPKNVFIRDCCSGIFERQVIVDGNLNIGNTIMENEECWEIYALGGTGIDGDYTTNSSFTNCPECEAFYPCVDDPNKPTLEPPNVIPFVHINTGGTYCGISGYVPVSEIFQFNIDEDCNFFDNRQIMFKNRYGVWDYFTFKYYRSEAVDIERENYGRTNISWGTNNPIKTNYSRGLNTYRTKLTEAHIVRSGFLNQPDFVWLEELYTSDDVFLIENDGTLFPINITSTNFVRKNKGNRSIIDVELTYVYSNNIKL